MGRGPFANTIAGFWSGKDFDERRDQGLLDEESAAEERENHERMRSSLTRFLKARGLLHGAGGDTFAVLEAVLAFLSGSAAEIVRRRRLRLSLEDAGVKRLLHVVNEKKEV